MYKSLENVFRAQYGIHEGTSQSAGFVAGAAALLLAAHRAAGLTTATGAQMKALLMQGAQQTPGLFNRTQSGARAAGAGPPMPPVWNGTSICCIP